MTFVSERGLRVSLVVLVMVLGGALQSPAVTAPAIVITNARIIDGHGGPPIEGGVLVVAGDTIQAVGHVGKVELPDAARVIDVQGKTVMPGLADMHVHFMGGWDGTRPDLLGYQSYLNSFLYAGVTTIMDMGNVEPYILQLRNEVNGGRLLGPRIYCVGPLIDGPEAQWPAFSVALAGRSQVPSLVAGLAANEVDFLKAYKGLSYRTLEALVREARRRSLGVIVDQGELNSSDVLSQLPIAAFAHVSGRRAIMDETLSAMRRNEIASLTTLAVLEYYSHQRLRSLDFLDDPLIREPTSPGMLDELRAFARRDADADDLAKQKRFTEILAQAQANVKRLHEAGILLVAGTDAPYPGVFLGEGIHRELELLVGAGLRPLEAITLATRNASRLVGDSMVWGSLEAGRRADLLIIDGRPDQVIGHTRNIDGVMLHGTLLDRRALSFDPARSRAFESSVKVETEP